MAIQIYAESGKLIHIGRLKENLAEIVVFDVSEMVDNFGSTGNFKIIVNQNKKEFFEVDNSLVTFDSSKKIVEWNVTEDYLLEEGEGKCQLKYIIGNIISKSEIYDIIVTFGVERISSQESE